jgi:alkylation response protein AidB-like acyl-CoA dehydrogenase
MDFSLTTEEVRLRDELRAWLADNAPGEVPAGDQASFDLRRQWQRKMFDAGWVGLSWPVEYGGRGTSRSMQAIVNEELARVRAPRLANNIGLEMGGPTIIEHGTPEQKERWLRPILSAQEIWCQAFSEPEAGSDLASLRTRARRVDGGWAVTGQKVWTSLAADATWCMLLARTDPDSKAHGGLSYFILELDQPGVDYRPIIQITGESEFNELFLDGAFIPDDHLLAGVGEGWKVATTTLMNERAGIALNAQIEARSALDELNDHALERGLGDDAITQKRLAELYVDSEGLRLLTYRGLGEIDREGRAGPRGSLAKWQWAELNQAVGELAMDVCGADGLDPDGLWTYRYLRGRANSIEGGTTEILKNIVAQRVLGLPRAT